MANIAGTGDMVDNPLRKVVKTPTINSMQDLANILNQNLTNYAKQGAKADEATLAKGGLTTNDYNSLVDSAKAGTVWTKPVDIGGAGGAGGVASGGTGNVNTRALVQTPNLPQYSQYQTSPTFEKLNSTPNININTPQYKAPTDDGVNVMSYIDQLTALQKQAKIADLQKARDLNLSNLNAESAKIDPQYYAQRGQTSTASQLSAKNFAEFMAQRGQTNSGFAGQSELNRNMQLQGDIGALNLQQQSANNDIARRTTDTNNGYNSDVVSSNASIDADSLDRKINQTNTDRSRADTLAQNSFDNAMQSANFDMNKAQAIFTMDLQRAGFNNDQIQQQWENNFRVTDANNQNAQNQFSNSMDVTKFNYGVNRDNVADTQWNKTYDMNKASNDANIANTQANTVYQNLVNQGYPAKQAMEMAQAQASLKGTNLNNEAQAIQNKFAPQIAQGTIDANSLSNAYQTMVNQGYPKEQAAELAYQNAQTKKLQLDNEAQAAKNKYASQIALSEYQQQVYNTEYAKAKAAGYNQELAATIAVKQAQTANYQNEAANRTTKTNYDIGKPYYNPKTGNNDNTKYNYKNDTSFQATYAAAIKDPTTNLAKLKADPQKFISAFGLDGFKALYTAASPKSQAIDFSFLEGLQ